MMDIESDIRLQKIERVGKINRVLECKSNERVEGDIDMRVERDKWIDRYTEK